VTAQAQPLQMQDNVRPNGKAATQGNGRWNKRRLSPKDPQEAARELTKEIDALFDHLGMRSEAERQEEEFKNAARTIKHLLRIEDHSFNAMILAGAGGTGKTRLVKETLFECALHQGEQRPMRVAWLEHHKVTAAQLLNDLHAYRGKNDVIVFDARARPGMMILAPIPVATAPAPMALMNLRRLAVCPAMWPSRSTPRGR
jgi:hypothetical protein